MEQSNLAEQDLICFRLQLQNDLYFIMNKIMNKIFLVTVLP